MLAGLGIGAVGAIAQGIMGASQAAKARKAIMSYDRQELTNVFEGLEISRLGADLQAEQLARTAASSVNALQMAGARGMVGGIGQVQKATADQARAIAADLDVQEKERQRLIAQDNANIRAMQERREEADLAGLGQQMAVGQQNLFGGIAGLGQIAGLATGALGSGGGQSSFNPFSALRQQGLNIDPITAPKIG